MASDKEFLRITAIDFEIGDVITHRAGAARLELGVRTSGGSRRHRTMCSAMIADVANSWAFAIFKAQAAPVF